jgi:uncharacterized protein YkwD
MGGGHTLLYESCPGGGQQEKVLRAAASCPVRAIVLDHRAGEATAATHSPQVKGLPATSGVWRPAALAAFARRDNPFMTSTRKHTSTGYRKRCAALGAATAATAAAMLLPAGGTPMARAQQCPTDTKATATSQITSDEQTQILQMHNDARAAASSSIPALTWDSSLADAAQGWANTLAPVTDNGFFLCHSSSAGENIALASTVQSGVQGWLDEKSSYSYPTAISYDNYTSFGHYTQMIWKNTTSIGCGKASAGRNFVLVCRYSPAGNVIGQTPY